MTLTCCPSGPNESAYHATRVLAAYHALPTNLRLSELPDRGSVCAVRTWVAFAENLDGRGALCVADPLVALLECLSLQTLPGETTAQEVHEHVAQRLQVVPPTLLWNTAEGRGLDGTGHNTGTGQVTGQITGQVTGQVRSWVTAKVTGYFTAQTVQRKTDHRYAIRCHR